MIKKPTREGEHEVIYLTPHCKDCKRELERYGDGLLWCSDPQDPCEDCGKEWIRYERHNPSDQERAG